MRPRNYYLLRDVIGLIPGPLQLKKSYKQQVFLWLSMDCLSERIRNVAAMALRYLWVYFQELFQHLLNGERKSPLPPRTFSGGRDEFNPPYIFLRDYLGIDPTQTVYTFSEHIINPVMVTHIIFSLVFAIGYCVVAEIFSESEIMAGDISRAYCDSGSPRYILPGAEFNAAAHSIAF